MPMVYPPQEGMHPGMAGGGGNGGGLAGSGAGLAGGMQNGQGVFSSADQGELFSRFLFAVRSKDE